MSLRDARKYWEVVAIEPDGRYRLHSGRVATDADLEEELSRVLRERESSEKARRGESGRQRPGLVDYTRWWRKLTPDQQAHAPDCVTWMNAEPETRAAWALAFPRGGKGAGKGTATGAVEKTEAVDRGVEVTQWPPGKTENKVDVVLAVVKGHAETGFPVTYEQIQGLVKGRKTISPSSISQALKWSRKKKLTRKVSDKGGEEPLPCAIQLARQESA